MYKSNKIKDMNPQSQQRAQQMNPPQNDATIQVVAERINSLHEDVTDLRCTMKESVREMSHAIQTLVRLEEKQLSLNLTAEETKKNFKELEVRVDALEKEQPETQRIVAWGYRAVWASVVAVAVFAAKAVGLM